MAPHAERIRRITRVRGRGILHLVEIGLQPPLLDDRRQARAIDRSLAQAFHLCRHAHHASAMSQGL
jgi:hypothetical protein